MNPLRAGLKYALLLGALAVLTLGLAQHRFPDNVVRFLPWAVLAFGVIAGNGIGLARAWIRRAPAPAGSLSAVIASACLAGLVWAHVRFLYSGPASLSFERHGESYDLLAPKMLALVFLAPYFVWFIGKSLADLPWPQRILSVLLRIAFVVLLALGLGRLARTSTRDQVCTVYLVDVSESVPELALQDAHDEIAKSVATRRKDDAFRIVTFAKRPRLVPVSEGSNDVPKIERHEPPLGADGSSAKNRQGLGAATDIASALELAYGLFPEGNLRRVVLFTDGVQTDGDLLAEASRAKEFGVKIHVVPYKRPVPGEVALRDLRVPDKVRVGEPFILRALVFSSRAQKVRATLKQGEAINGLEGIKVVDLVAGENEIPFKSVTRVAGEVTYQLDLSEMEEDRFRENNHFAVTVAVPGRPAVLYVEGDPSRASHLSRALSSQEFDVDVRGPRELPSSLKELERYDFVILSDAPAEAVSLTQQDAIESYVRDLGGGFLFAGGEHGYGLGGWYHTTIERILPVSMDAEKRRDEPQVALALVIDRSGSMSGAPMEMAKAAAKATADTLASEDLLEVIAFDSQPTRVVKMSAAKHRARIQNDISRIQAGGGTEIFGALDAAFQSLSVTRAKRKHIILLTDGQAPNNGIRELVQSMVAEGITATTVGLGSGIDQNLLRMIAEVGGGRFLPVADPQSLPKVFTREAEMVSRSAAVEEYFQPIVVGAADFMRGVDLGSAPFLHGYVATKMKPPPAQELLQSDVREPILARWHVGLGWSVAWTSDVKNLWAVEWLRWPGYGQFWGQLVREHMRQKKRQQFDMKAEIDSATGNVRTYIDAIGGDDSFQNGLLGRIEVKGPEPGGDKREITMKQTAPGRYEADFPLERFGSYVMHASLDKLGEDKSGKETRVQMAESFGHITNPYPREYLALATDRTTLSRAAQITGGMMDPPANLAFDPAGERIKYHEDLWSRFIYAAIGVFLLDLFVRRARLFDRKRTFKSGAPERPVPTVSRT